MEKQICINGTPLSCSDIAAILGRNTVSVYRAIKRIGLEPLIATNGGYKFYAPESVDLLDKAMRRKNGYNIPISSSP